MVEPELENWVPVQASYTNNTTFFLFLEPEPKKLDARYRSLKFEYRLHSPVFIALHYVRHCTCPETYVPNSRQGVQSHILLWLISVSSESVTKKRFMRVSGVGAQSAVLGARRKIFPSVAGYTTW